MRTNVISISKQLFDTHLPIRYSSISTMHWTSENIIKKVVGVLEQYGAKSVLDIGSGVGKFCLVGAQHSNLHFTGIEKRKKLYKQALKIQKELKVKNVNFINDNIVNRDLTDFDSIYFFNPFGEQISDSDWIDNDREFSLNKFLTYQDHVFQFLQKSKKGMILVTYCSEDFHPPRDFVLKENDLRGKVQLWIKE